MREFLPGISREIYVFFRIPKKNSSRNRENGEKYYNSALSSVFLKEIINELLKRMIEHLVSLGKCLTTVSCLCGGGKDDFLALADRNEIALLAKSLLEILLKGKLL
jgi:RNase adaptor protein for sRNA GlmZ degradation